MKGGVKMLTPRIKKVKVLEDYKLLLIYALDVIEKYK